MNLNAGCGFKRKKNWVNLDKYQQLNPDIVADLDKGLPFKNEIFEKILLSHVLEHISDVVFTMNELYRVMKSGGIMTIEVPEFPTHGSIADPSHKHFFTRNSFRYFVVGWCSTWDRSLETI